MPPTINATVLHAESARGGVSDEDEVGSDENEDEEEEDEMGSVSMHNAEERKDLFAASHTLNCPVCFRKCPSKRMPLLLLLEHDSLCVRACVRVCVNVRVCECTCV